MATKGDPDQPGRWKGAEVEDQPADEAERAADRAEGNKPVRAADEAARHRHPSIDEQPVDERNSAARSTPSDESISAEEKIAEAARGHQDREVSAGLPPRGKL